MEIFKTSLYFTLYERTSFATPVVQYQTYFLKVSKYLHQDFFISINYIKIFNKNNYFEGHVKNDIHDNKKIFYSISQPTTIK